VQNALRPVAALPASTAAAAATATNSAYFSTKAPSMNYQAILCNGS